jgi:hypothetical protein
VYADVATALGYVNKEQQYSARTLFKVEVKRQHKQLRHPLYGDLILAAGVPALLGRFARYQATSLDKFQAAKALQNWLENTAKVLIDQPVASSRLLESSAARQMTLAPIDFELTRTIQTFQCWHNILGEGFFTTRQVIDQADGTPLAGLLLDIAASRRDPDVVSDLRLGSWLARRVGFDFGGWVLPPVISRKNDVKRWTLRKVAP